MKSNEALLENEPILEADSDSIASHMKSILSKIGEDAGREGLVRTPERAEKALRFLTSGYETNIDQLINGALFTHECDEMIIVKDIEIYSTCEHHLVPFHGVAHVGYIPNVKGEITGLSKIARLVDLFAKRPQVQERLTAQIADAMEEILEPRGVIVVVECEHLCMSMRGVRKPGARTVTSAVRGAFRESDRTRSEALGLISRH